MWEGMCPLLYSCCGLTAMQSRSSFVLTSYFIFRLRALALGPQPQQSSLFCVENTLPCVYRTYCCSQSVSSAGSKAKSLRRFSFRIAIGATVGCGYGWSRRWLIVSASHVTRRIPWKSPPIPPLMVVELAVSYTSIRIITKPPCYVE